MARGILDPRNYAVQLKNLKPWVSREFPELDGFLIREQIS